MQRTAPRLGLSLSSLSARALQTEYAVRGKIAVRANEIGRDLATGSSSFPFKSMILLNTGNPQNHEQKPFSFPHDVCALLESPKLRNSDAAKQLYKPDVLERAEYIAKETNGQLGGYTMTKGFPFVRRAIAEFIAKRDDANAGKALGPVDIENIFLSNGASGGVTALMTAFVASEADGVMIPIPQYPLYTATLALLGGSVSPYFLDESNGWAMSAETLEASYQASIDKGVTPKALVVINPGNPTGQVLDRDVLQSIVDWAYKRDMLLVSDEVYQENVYAAGKKFYSMREIVLSSPGDIPQKVQLASLHTVSKGVFGECGRRGGYMELLNVPADVRAQIEKLLALQLSPNNWGQLMTYMMAARPQPGDASYTEFQQHYDEIFESLKVRAKLLVDELRPLPGIGCNEIEGALYAFPNMKLPTRFIAEAADEKVAPDFKWCMGLLEEQGVVTVPGSGFGQAEGTNHVRLTILPPKHEMDDVTKRIATYHHALMSKYQ